MDFALMVRVFPFFLQATGITLVIALLSVVLGLFVGAIVTAAKLSQNNLVWFLGSAYVSVFRGTPALVQIFLLYFGGPQIGLQLNAITAGTLGLGLNIAAYMAETMRGAILAVDKGQTDAARAVGMSRLQATRYIIVPQALRLMVRPLGVNINAQIKATALVSAISVVELTYTAQRYIGSTYKPFEVFFIAGVLYLAVIHATGFCIRWLDRRVALK